jgi:hypothetical protein
VAEPDQHRDRPAHNDLPAPYVNPWGVLGGDLLAVLASLRLGVWQLWRRNREGDLPRPGFWPQALAAWFWPALLVLLLLAGSGVLALLPPVPQGPSAPAPAPAGQPLVPDLGLGAAAADDPIVGAPTADAIPAPDPPAEEPIADPVPPPDSPARPPDPLLQAFAGEQRAELLQAAGVRQVDGDLELVLDQLGWQQLPAAERQELAEAWQRRAQSLGYGRLWLLDAQGTPLARSARVGSGMILLASSLPAHAP